MSSNNDVDAKLARHGGLSYLEIPAVDIQQAAAFYKNTLGWNVSGEATDQLKFTDRTGHLIGRWVAGRAISREPGMLPYFYVDQIEDAVNQATLHGGEIVKAIYREGNLYVAMVRDPAGNAIGLWQDGGA